MASETPAADDVVMLDHDSLRLLVCLERGHLVRMHDEPELRWQVLPRMVVPVQPWDDGTVVLVDADPFTFVGSPILGSSRPLDDWLPAAEFVRLTAGILLIRTGMARRQGYVLEITDHGRLLAEPLIAGMTEVHEEPRRPRRATAGRPPSYEICASPVPVDVLAPINAEQRITVSPASDGPGSSEILLEVGAGDRAIVGRIDPRRAALLRSRMETDATGLPSRRDVTPLIRLETEAGVEKLVIDMLQDFTRSADFDRAIVSMRPPATHAFRRALTAALDLGETTIIEDVAVAYASFDAVTRPSGD